MSKYFKLRKIAELDDKAIIETLKKLPKMYENGELVEVMNACYEIGESIDDFQHNYKKDM